MPTFTNRSGHDIFFHDWGSGPTLVFVHGGAINADCWEYQTVPLSDRCRVIAPDTRGCGRSGEPHRGYGYDDLADDLADLITTLDLHDVVLVGHSMGAGTIVRYFSRHNGDRVRGVVMVAPITPFMVHADDNPGGVPAAVFEESVALLRVNRPYWIEAAAPAFFGADPDETLLAKIEWGKGLARSSGAQATIGLFDSFWRTDFRGELRSVDVPVLVCHGDADMTAPLDLCGRPTVAGLPDAELRVYDGASHGLFLTHADRLVADIAAHAERVLAVRAS